jgi:hypothetical protein
MVINENTKSVNVLEVGGFGIVSWFNLIHGFTTAKYVLNCIVHWIVEQSCQIILIWTNIGRVSIKAFAHLENTCGCSIFRPKTFRNFWNCVNSYSIKAIGLNEIFNPILKILTNIRIVLIKIWQTCKTTIFNRVLIVPVNITIWMIVWWLI